MSTAAIAVHAIRPTSHRDMTLVGFDRKRSNAARPAPVASSRNTVKRVVGVPESVAAPAAKTAPSTAATSATAQRNTIDGSKSKQGTIARPSPSKVTTHTTCQQNSETPLFAQPISPLSDTTSCSQVQLTNHLTYLAHIDCPKQAIKQLRKRARIHNAQDIPLRRSRTCFAPIAMLPPQKLFLEVLHAILRAIRFAIQSAIRSWKCPSADPRTRMAA
jgi:hypothetical protein